MILTFLLVALTACRRHRGRGGVALRGSVLAMLFSSLLSGCALFEGGKERPFIRTPLVKPQQIDGRATESAAPQFARQTESATEQKTGYFQTPKPPAAQRSQVGKPAPAVQPGPEDEAITLVNLESQTIPQFANAVFGAILKRNVSIDPQVQQRTDLVSLRTGKPQTAEQLFLAAQAVLRSYGVAVQEFQGLIRVVPDKAESGYLPEIRRGRAQPDVPGGLRPVFYLAELEHTSVASVSSWIRTLFTGRINVQDDSQRNALLLSGQSDTMVAAMEAIQLLDQPLLRGRVSARVVPVFWSADEMARRLMDILIAEGYSVAQNASAQTPILVLPVAPANSIIIFTANQETLDHVLHWTRELDQTPRGKSGGFINYQVRNTNAADLARALQEILGVSAPPVATTGGSATPPAIAGSVGKKVVVNPTTNSLIIQTTPTEHQQWHGLLQELDRPAKSALIMATVAEVRLTESEQFGFQWLLDQFHAGGNLVNIGTASTLSTAGSGPRISFSNLSGNPRALLTFLANSNKIRILSNPSIVARNGEAATIQVGQEVPILTSQISNANTGGTTGTGILQTIQYRNTGVILRVKPVIHSGGRLDLDVSQEVSAAQINETGVNATPVILSRRVDTKLTVTDGNTMLLGGLISENRTGGNAGIPLLKDIPYIGPIFRTSTSVSTERTELVILLTPYILEDDFEAQAMTDVFRGQFGWAQALPRIDGATTPPTAGKGGATAKPRDVTNIAPPAATSYLSKPYLLSEPGAEAATLPSVASGVASAPQPGDDKEPLQEGKQPTRKASVAESKPNGDHLVAPARSHDAGRPVVDEALRRELLKAARDRQQ